MFENTKTMEIMVAELVEKYMNDNSDMNIIAYKSANA